MDESAGKPWWKTLWAKLVAGVVTVIAVIGAINDGFEFHDNLKRGKQCVSDAADWLYPLPLIGVLVAMLVVAVVIAVVATRRLSRARADLQRAEASRSNDESELAALRERNAPERTNHDTRILSTLVTTLPRGDITYWKELDFGGTWMGEKTHHLLQIVYDQNELEDQFLDPELEKLRKEVVIAAKHLLEKTSHWGGPSYGNPGVYDLGRLDGLTPDQHKIDEFQKRRDERVAELTQRADALVAAYDELVRIARARLPKAFDRGDRS